MASLPGADATQAIQLMDDAALKQAVTALSQRVEAAAASVTEQLATLAAAQEELLPYQRALREREDEALKQLVLAPLFPDLASLVFAQLPVDSRLRCREVCRGWRAFLADVRFWQVCDLSAASGVALRSPALLRAASERARGTLSELNVSGWYREPGPEGEAALDDEQLLAVLRANAVSLFQLRTWKLDVSAGQTSVETIEQLLIAAPRLRLLECDAILRVEEAVEPVPRLLREPHFAPLRLKTLVVDAPAVVNAPAVQPLDVPALAAWAATHPSLNCLALSGVHLGSQPALDAVVSLATSQLENLVLLNGRLSPASLPAVSRMLESRSLSVLFVHNGNMPLVVGASVPAFCTALLASRPAFSACACGSRMRTAWLSSPPAQAIRRWARSTSWATAKRMLLAERPSRLRWTRCRHPFPGFTSVDDTPASIYATADRALAPASIF